MMPNPVWSKKRNVLPPVLRVGPFLIMGRYAFEHQFCKSRIHTTAQMNWNVKRCFALLVVSVKVNQCCPPPPPNPLKKAWVLVSIKVHFFHISCFPNEVGIYRKTWICFRFEQIYFACQIRQFGCQLSHP